ncbi:hypothetical protein L228DRAFT_168414 [Xylona heveae TC161]|uniref:Uncharacterized protein n=1 Tax=Xylona heveae (strain CBS 132557 / TC161) TaxID=1328760 RepID=A0A165FP73_XYLHT|nr:hypothetical protein L228DRAFT_168414 [Xylona heveae TC161]KZF21218.1 hypothetical protein L228DRAFT_168414 [Xylona heveae TC161]
MLPFLCYSPLLPGWTVYDFFPFTFILFFFIFFFLPNFWPMHFQFIYGLTKKRKRQSLLSWIFPTCLELISTISINRIDQIFLPVLVCRTCLIGNSSIDYIVCHVYKLSA